MASLVVPVAQPIATVVVGALGDQPDRSWRQFLACLVDDRHASVRAQAAPSSRASPASQAVVIADRQPEFGGAEMIHRRARPRRARKNSTTSAVQRLAATRYRPNAGADRRRSISPCAIRLRSTVGVVARLVTLYRRMMSRQTSAVALGSTHSTGSAQRQRRKIAAQPVTPARIAGRPEHIGRRGEDRGRNGRKATWRPEYSPRSRSPSAVRSSRRCR